MNPILVRTDVTKDARCPERRYRYDFRKLLILMMEGFLTYRSYCYSIKVSMMIMKLSNK